MNRGARYLVFLTFIAALVLGLSTSLDRSACAAGTKDRDEATGLCTDGTGSCGLPR